MVGGQVQATAAGALPAHEAQGQTGGGPLETRPLQEWHDLPLWDEGRAHAHSSLALLLQDAVRQLQAFP